MPQGWQTSGAYVGKRVVRNFPNSDTPRVQGRVVAWLPPEINAEGGEVEQALWHVVHDDDDEEDLDHAEVQAAVKEAEQTSDLLGLRIHADDCSLGWAALSGTYGRRQV